MAFATKSIQMSGTIAAQIKAHDTAERDYKEALRTLTTAIREAEKAFFVEEKSISIRSDLEIIDTTNASTRELRKAANLLDRAMMDFENQNNKDLRDWAVRHYRIILLNEGDLSLNQTRKTAEALERESVNINKTLARYLEDAGEVMHSVEDYNLNRYVSDEAMKKFQRTVSASARGQTGRSIPGMGAGLKKSWENINDPTVTGNATDGYATVYDGIQFILSHSDAHLGSVVYSLWKKGQIDSTELVTIYDSHSGRMTISAELYNLFLKMFDAPAYLYLSDEMQEESY